MPKTELTNEQSAELERVKQLFSDWRKTRSGRERIPDSLWNAAADLFHTWGLRSMLFRLFLNLAEIACQ